ncbi:MAG: hypothetical protein IBX69_16900 [Anaerolineales bacterium]|nr:hypothetical protein [Anaerolineales bacterium]
MELKKRLPQKINPVAACAGYIAHPSEYLGNGDAMSLKIGYYAGQS